MILVGLSFKRKLKRCFKNVYGNEKKKKTTIANTIIKRRKSWKSCIIQYQELP